MEALRIQMTVGECRRTDRFVRHARSPPERLSRSSAPKEETWVGRKRREAGAEKGWQGRRGLKRRVSWWPHTNICSPKVCTFSRPLVPHFSSPFSLWFWSLSDLLSMEFLENYWTSGLKLYLSFPLVFLGRMDGITLEIRGCLVSTQPPKIPVTSNI